MTTTKTKLPKWFKGEVYPKGDTVKILLVERFVN